MLQKTILFDTAHNEMLNIEDKEFSDFANLLRRLDITIKLNDSKHLVKDVVRDVDLLVIGNAIDDLFSSNEIKIVVDFVRSGGGLLLLSEYGSDYLQKTNINDLSGKFGIKFEKNLIKEVNKANQNCTSTLHIQKFSKNQLTKHIREIRIGGACSIFLSKDAKPLLKSEQDSWPEIFDSTNEQWIKEGEEEEQIIAAFTEFGQGKVVAIGDIDIFTSDSNIGLNSLDNQRFLQNIINWLIEPVQESKVMTFILNQLGDLHFEIRETNKIINNIIETMTILEKRISYLEEQSQAFSQTSKIEKKSEEESLQEE
ncbi:MAG: hypothetical protein KGD58_09295 [Candidatus Lokiarchaeota archaeon]|nr:hypothetical protein [Candidatus Lokiarchaeota archaeon]